MECTRWVKASDVAACSTVRPNAFDLGHARLKDYVSSMSGQLDAQINEGGQ